MGPRGYFGDVWRLALEPPLPGERSRGAWAECDAVGAAPSPREGHAGAVVDYTFVVVGGNDGGGWRNDVYALNLETLVWRRAAW